MRKGGGRKMLLWDEDQGLRGEETPFIWSRLIFGAKRTNIGGLLSRSLRLGISRAALT